LFSSSASVYKTKNTPLTEDGEKHPLSPYAKSKWMVEQVIGDFSEAYKLPATVFRYFNACGAVGSKHGQNANASHIFPRLMEATREFDLYGNDFKTPDGTCIRDYIHVTDIADAHVKAVEKTVYGVYNLGSNNGFSNKQIIDAVNKKLIVNVLGRRLGDTDCLVADNTFAKSMLGWVPLSTLSDIIKDLNEWYSSDNFKGIKNV
jgi:UDP-glucose 4-epimerase